MSKGKARLEPNVLPVTLMHVLISLGTLKVVRNSFSFSIST